MKKDNDYSSLFSGGQYKESKNKRSKLYRLLNGIKTEKKKSLKEPTAAQANQRFRFGLATTFARQLKEMIDIGFFNKKKPMTPMNISTKQILRDAIIGDYPLLFIDYRKVILSMGDLARLEMCTMWLSNEGKLQLKWENDPYPHKLDQGDDGLFLFVYNATEEMAFNFPNVALRSGLELSIQLPLFNESDDYHFWIFMASENHRYVSNSTYFNFSKTLT